MALRSRGARCRNIRLLGIFASSVPRRDMDMPDQYVLCSWTFPFLFILTPD